MRIDIAGVGVVAFEGMLGLLSTTDVEAAMELLLDMYKVGQCIGHKVSEVQVAVMMLSDACNLGQCIGHRPSQGVVVGAGGVGAKEEGEGSGRPDPY